MRYAKWPHYPHGHITHLSPTIVFIYEDIIDIYNRNKIGHKTDTCGIIEKELSTRVI